MDTKTTDLPGSSVYRLFEKFSQEAKIVSLSGFSALAAVLAALMALMAWNDAKEAKIKMEVELAAISRDLRRNNDDMEYLESVWVALRADLEAQGYEFPEGTAYVREQAKGAD